MADEFFSFDATIREAQVDMGLVRLLDGLGPRATHRFLVQAGRLVKRELKKTMRMQGRPQSWAPIKPSTLKRMSYPRKKAGAKRAKHKERPKPQRWRGQERGRGAVKKVFGGATGPFAKSISFKIIRDLVRIAPGSGIQELFRIHERGDGVEKRLLIHLLQSDIKGINKLAEEVIDKALRAA